MPGTTLIVASSEQSFGRHKWRSPGSELQLLLPKPAREQLFLDYHASLFGGHLGRNRTLAQLSHLFYWSGMSDDVKVGWDSVQFA